MKNIQLITLCLLVLLMSCNKDDGPSSDNPNQEPDPTAFAENFGSEIQRNFLGNVIDANRNPIQGVTITIGSKTSQTDANGIFIINDATVHQRFGYVKAEKVGYLHGSRSVVPSSGTNKVTIMLLQENVVGTVNSGTPETIALSNGASVALQGDYKKEDGTAYSGSVNVIMHHLDPSDDDMKDQMPGMLYAANNQNEERMLQTFGMLAVELRGSGGENLNLADGSSAEIKMPLDASLMSTAPSTIPLWHFDETYGYWIEDGEATLVGNAYIGTVTHFSFWNCDIPAKAVNLSVQVLDAEQNALSYITVKIISSIYGASRGVTNSSGWVSGLVPEDETLVLELFDASLCGDVALYTTTIGPFSVDSFIEISIPNSPSIISEKVFGDFNTCSGNPITDGYVMLESNNIFYFDSVDDGNFEMTFSRCVNPNNIFKLKAFDHINTQETDNINYTFTSPITNVGTIASCNVIEEFITYQIDGNETITYYSQITGVMDGQNYLSCRYVAPSNSGSDNYLFLTVVDESSPLSIGSYASSDTFLTFIDDEYATESNGLQVDITVNISLLGNVGEYIDMNFTGTFIGTDAVSHTITGTVHALRDF
ncbi:MAG: hypothetical protein ACSHXF_05300 [Aquaticitalea sp.]